MKIGALKMTLAFPHIQSKTTLTLLEFISAPKLMKKELESLCGKERGGQCGPQLKLKQQVPVNI